MTMSTPDMIQTLETLCNQSYRVGANLADLIGTLETQQPADLDALYTDRARILALLSLHYPAHLSPATDAESGFQYVLCIHLPEQVSWHIADRDLSLFSHLRRVNNHYDGHSTQEKESRLEHHLDRMHMFRKQTYPDV